MTETDLEFRDGRWQLAVPLPFYGLLHVKCHCRRRFWGRAAAASGRYERHYRSDHAKDGS